MHAAWRHRHIASPSHHIATVFRRRRNRLGHDKANKLVGLFHNLRLLKRMKTPEYSEPTIAWAEDLEHSGVTKYKPTGASHPSALLRQPIAGSGSDPKLEGLQLP